MLLYKGCITAVYFRCRRKWVDNSVHRILIEEMCNVQCPVCNYQANVAVIRLLRAVCPAVLVHPLLECQSALFSGRKAFESALDSSHTPAAPGQIIAVHIIHTQREANHLTPGE